MLSDRYRAAFAREAINNLAEVDAARIHTIDFDGKAIASMVVLMMNGEAYTWKTAYRRELSPAFSPGKLLDGPSDRLASRRRQYRPHRFLRGAGSSDHEPLLGRSARKWER